jgi:hypothetical protein
MSVAGRLERMSRMLPGIGSYQNREALRDADKAVRDRVAAGLDERRRDLEKDKKRRIDARDLAFLTELDELATKIERLAAAIRFGARGYRAVFDSKRFDEERLDRLYEHDLGLLREIEALGELSEKLHAAAGGSGDLGTAADAMSAALERLERTFRKRDDILST